MFPWGARPRFFSRAAGQLFAERGTADRAPQDFRAKTLFFAEDSSKSVRTDVLARGALPLPSEVQDALDLAKGGPRPRWKCAHGWLMRCSISCGGLDRTVGAGSGFG